MLRSELLTHLHAQFPNLSLRATEAMLDVLFAEISAALGRGERVELRGFGAFSVRQRKARTGRNPRTGEIVPVDQKCVPFFKPGKDLRERVNSATHSEDHAR